MAITTAHIMVTSLCDRDCQYCCNKQYDLNDIPYITSEELSRMKRIYITGGEPFRYSDPCNIAKKLKREFKNIERVIVYTNALELGQYLLACRMVTCLHDIDGLTISIKSYADRFSYERYISRFDYVKRLKHNRVYVFPGFEDVKVDAEHFQKIKRVWQEKFVPAPNCIFRKL